MGFWYLAKDLGSKPSTVTPSPESSGDDSEDENDDESDRLVHINQMEFEAPKDNMISVKTNLTGGHDSNWNGEQRVNDLHAFLPVALIMCQNNYVNPILTMMFTIEGTHIMPGDIDEMFRFRGVALRICHAPSSILDNVLKDVKVKNLLGELMLSYGVGVYITVRLREA